MVTAHTARTAWRARLVKRARTRTRIGRLVYRALTLVLDSILQLARRVRCVGLGSSLQGTWHLAWTVGVVSTATVARASDVLRGLSRRTTRVAANRAQRRATVLTAWMVCRARLVALAPIRMLSARLAIRARTWEHRFTLLPARRACHATLGSSLLRIWRRVWTARLVTSVSETRARRVTLDRSHPTTRGIVSLASWLATTRTALTV